MWNGRLINLELETWGKFWKMLGMVEKRLDINLGSSGRFQYGYRPFLPALASIKKKGIFTMNLCLCSSGITLFISLVASDLMETIRKKLTSANYFMTQSIDELLLLCIDFFISKLFVLLFIVSDFFYFNCMLRVVWCVMEKKISK